MVNKSNRDIARKPREVAATRILGLFFIATVVAPSVVINKILFVVLAVWMVGDALRGKKLLMAPFVVAMIFGYGFAVALMTAADMELAVQFLFATLLLFLINFIRWHRIDLDPLVDSAALALLFFTALYSATKFLPGFPLSAALQSFFETASLGATSEREFLDSPTLSLHLGTVPFLFLALTLRSVRFLNEFKLKDGLLMMLIMVGILASASRGLIAVSVIMVALIALMHIHIYLRPLVLLIVVVFAYLAVGVLLSNSAILSSGEISNAAKLGHLQSYFDDLTPMSGLFGRGLASFYYSVGSGTTLAHTEITPLDMARYFGVALTVVLYLVLIFPTKRVAVYGGENRIWVVAFLLYVLLSATNPVMFNSYGLLIVVWYWHKLLPTARTCSSRLPAVRRS